MFFKYNMHLMKFFIRNYSSVHQNCLKEIIRNVHPFSKINIQSMMNLKIKPYDLLDCPDANLLRATIVPNQSQSTSSTSFPDSSLLSFNVEIKDDFVNIRNLNNDQIMDDLNRNCTCLLEVPVKSDLNVNTKQNIEIKDMHSDKIELITQNGDINTKNLRSSLISLYSKNGGNINCKGLLLAQNSFIKTEQNGSIHLDKLQGDYLECHSIDGGINTNSCYVDHSKFITKNGNLNLKNVHKQSEVILEQKGSVTMVGIHGNTNIKGNASIMNLHFDELYGDNSIILNDKQNMQISISDLIENDCCIEIYAENIILDKTIEHLQDYLKNHKYFHTDNKNKNNLNNKLLISTKGSLRLSKKSWADNIRTTLGLSDSVQIK